MLFLTVPFGARWRRAAASRPAALIGSLARAAAPLGRERGLAAASLTETDSLPEPAPSTGRGDTAARPPHGWLAKLLADPVTILCALFLLAMVTRLHGVDLAITADEGYWMQRSVRFGAALARGDLASTYRSGHPGVTVMWTGVLGMGPGRLAEFLPPQYVSYTLLEASDGYLPALAAARRAVVLATSLLSVVAVGLLWKLVGPGAALVGGLLMLLDPYILSTSRLLHVDALLPPLMAVSVLAGLIYWLGERQLRYLALSGISAGLALLTKAPAACMPLYAALLGVAACWSQRPAQAGAELLPYLARRLAPLALWGMLALLIYVALWPALWVEPLRRIRDVIEFALFLGSNPHTAGNFFLGQPVLGDPGPLFYPVALALRLSPITLAGLLLLPLALDGGNRRVQTIVALTAFVLLFIAVMTVGAKKLDRYMLPAIFVLDLLAGTGLWLFARRVRKAGLAMVVTSLAVALQAALLWRSQPYPLAFYNPLFGGAATAEQMILVGWGEGLEQAAAYLNRRPDAARLTLATSYNHVVRPRFRGTTISIATPETADYYLVYINTLQRQQLAPAVIQAMEEAPPELIAEVNGLPYAWLYRAPAVLREAPPATPRSDPDEGDG